MLLVLAREPATAETCLTASIFIAVLSSLATAPEVAEAPSIFRNAVAASVESVTIVRHVTFLAKASQFTPRGPI